MQLEGTTVVITGASRGIGRAVAELAARRGARLGLIARSEEDLRTVAAGLGGRTSVAVADVGDRDQVAAAVSSLEADLGPTDVLVANAGIGAYGRFAGIDLDEVERLVRVNLLGTIFPLRVVLPGMIERGRGHLAVVASVAGRFGSPFEGVYAATKFGQVGLAEAVGVEVSGTGVGVTIVDPGVVDTDFFSARGHSYDRSFPRPIPAEKVAAALVRAVERGRTGEVFVPGWFRYALAFRHLAPSLYWRGTRRSFRSELAE